MNIITDKGKFEIDFRCMLNDEYIINMIYILIIDYSIFGCHIYWLSLLVHFLSVTEGLSSTASSCPSPWGKPSKKNKYKMNGNFHYKPSSPPLSNGNNDNFLKFFFVFLARDWIISDHFLWLMENDTSLDFLPPSPLEWKFPFIFISSTLMAPWVSYRSRWRPPAWPGRRCLALKPHTRTRRLSR